MDWLQTTNPQINWAACTLTCVVGAESRLLTALPVRSVAHVKLSSLKQVLNVVKRGGEAWFALMRPTEGADTMEVLNSLEVGDGVGAHTSPSR